MNADERGFGNLRFSAALCVYLRSLWPKRKYLAAWKQERAFIRQLVRRGPVAGGRAWRRKTFMSVRGMQRQL